MGPDLILSLDFWVDCAKLSEDSQASGPGNFDE